MVIIIKFKIYRNTGEFMMSRYREVADIVIRYLEHRDRLVRLSITSLLPRIAHFLRDRFKTHYLTVCKQCFNSILSLPFLLQGRIFAGNIGYLWLLSLFRYV